MAMRILHCLHNYHPARGGAESLMKEVSERMAGRGHDVRVLCTNARSTEDYFLPGKGRDLLPVGTEKINGVSVTRVPFRRSGAAALNLLRAAACRIPFPSGDYWRMLSWGPRSRAYRRTAMETRDIDLIAGCPLPTLNVRSAWAASRRNALPFVVIPCFHTEDRWTYHHPEYYRWMRDAAAVICLTGLEKEFFRENAGIPAERLFVGGVGIDPPADDGPREAEARKPEAKRKVLAGRPGGDHEIILFLGQHSRHKGILDLLRAMPGVWRERPRTVLVIAGNPTAFTAVLEGEIAKLPADGRGKVRLIKGVDEAEKKLLLEAADVFVSVSPFESFGIVFLEAWRAGLPVVGCRRGASARVIDEFRDGLLVRDEKPAVLSGALLTLLKDPDLRRRMVASGIRKVKDVYAWDRIIPAWESIYENAVRG